MPLVYYCLLGTKSRHFFFTFGIANIHGGELFSQGWPLCSIDIEIIKNTTIIIMAHTWDRRLISDYYTYNLCLCTYVNCIHINKNIYIIEY